MFVGNHGRSRIFRCTMKHNRKNCAAIYCEEEYEKLVLEAYWQAKAKTKLANNRYQFTCIHCKESHKDKNTLSYHRMFNLCKGYTGKQPLKMYPTWEPSNHREKVRIAAKYGKVSSPTVPQFPSLAVFPPPLELDALPVCSTKLTIDSAEQYPTSRKRKLQNSVLPTKAPLHSLGGRPCNLAIGIPYLSPSSKAQNLAVNATSKISKSTPPSKCRLKAKKQPSRRAIISSSEEDLNSAGLRSESESTTKEATPNSQKSGHGEFCVVKHEHGLCAQSSYKHVLRAQNLHKAVLHVEDLQKHVLHAQDLHEHVLHAQSSHEVVVHVQHRPLSREECKQQAHEEAMTLFNAHNEIASPPELVPVHPLYILITGTNKEWVPKELLDDPNACMRYLHKQLEDGTIRQHISSAFGRWYLFGNTQVFLSYAVFFCSTRVFYVFIL